MTTISNGQTSTVTTSTTTSYTVLAGGELLVNGTGASVNSAVISGGELYLSKGSASNTVMNGGVLYVSGGNTVSGATTVANGGSVELATSGGIINGSLTFGSGGGALVLDKVVSQAGLNSATLSNFAAGDAIEIAGTYTGATLSTTVSGGVTSVTFAATSAGSAFTQTIDVAGSLANSFDLLTTTISTVSLGKTSGVEILFGQDVSVGAGAALAVFGGGSAASTTVSSGGALNLSGTASDTTVVGGGTVDLATAGATLTGALTFSSGGNTLLVSALASSGAGDQAVISGFGQGDVIDVAALSASGASLSFATSGGNEIVTVANGGASESFVFSGTTAYTANTLSLTSDTKGGAEIALAAGGVTISVTTPTSSGAYDVTSGATLLVLSGGSVSAARIESSGTLIVSGGVDVGAVVSSGATETVAAGSATGDQIAGSATVLGGAASGETVLAGGALTVSGGSVSSDTVQKGGALTVVSGGAASGDTISGALIVSGGSVTSETIVSGGSATLNAGAVDSAMTVLAGATLTVSAATGSAKLTGDQIYGTVNTVSGLAATFNNETVFAGGVLNLYNSNNADDAVVSSGGLLLLSGHETATDTTLVDGGTLELDSPKATLAGSLTFSGQDDTLLLADKLASATYGTLATISGFTGADQIVIASGLFVTSTITSSAGLLSLTVSGGGQADTLVFSGGGYSASDVSFSTLANGDEEILIAVPVSSAVTTSTASGAYKVFAGETLTVSAGGSVSAATVKTLGTLDIEGGADSAAVVRAGGALIVGSGSASGDTISGVATVSGGAVSSETVASGGVLALDGGATSNVTLNGGATLDLASGAALSGSLTFANGNNTFVVSAGADPSQTTISGYLGDDKIDIAGIASSGATLSFTSNVDGTETVTVANGGSSETFQFASAATYNASSLSLAADGTGVDLVRDTTPAIAFTTLDDLTTNQSTYIVHGTVGVGADPYAIGATVDVLENGKVVGAGTVAANGYWSATVDLANASGANSLTASVTDAAGQTGTSAALNVTADVGAAAFQTGDLVLSISGDGDGSGVYGDNQASPITLEEVTASGTIVSQLVLPQTTTTVDGVTEYTISGEYGSSSEGTLQLSADGHSLTIAGYGVDDAVFNAGGASVYGTAALAQSTSIPGGADTVVPRVIADVGASGVVDDSTNLYDIFNVNNPRSVVTVNGASFIVSGQGDKNATGIDQGVFSVTPSASSAPGAAATVSAIYSTVDTRDVEIYNGEVYVSIDSSQGAAGIYDLGSVASVESGTAASTPLPILTGANVVLTAADANGVNNAAIGTQVNLSPENFYFANATTLYVADGGAPKAGGVGDGGLQKWSLVDGSWRLDYTLSQGLTFVNNASGSATGDTGLIGLTGEVNDNGTVSLYATTEPLADLGDTALVAIDDALNATTLPASESFTTLVTASAGENIRGVAFAPTAPCFCTGVRILTARGEIAVEALQVGDEVVTASGALRPICWIGRRTLDLTRHPLPEKVWPVRVRRDAFGAGLPRRDLWLSPEHCLAVDGALIPAYALVNGQSVEQVRKSAVTYWHVELDAHDVLLSEGLPSESYLDTGNRFAFENGGAFVEAHPDFAPRHWAQTCLPLALEGAPVVKARSQLLERLAEAGYEIVSDADMHIMADRVRIEPVQISESRFVFALPGGCQRIVLESRRFVPAHTVAKSADSRELGLCVAALEIGGAAATIDAQDNLPGWNRPEFKDGRFTHRWTKDAVALPAGAREVVVKLAGRGYYGCWVESPDQARYA